MIQVSMEEFHLFLQGRELEGQPTVGFSNASMTFLDKNGKVQARATYAANGGYVTVRYEIRTGE